MIVDDLNDQVDWPFLAGLRQYPRQFARPKPAIERARARARPWLFKLDDDLDRRLVAGD